MHPLWREEEPVPTKGDHEIKCLTATFPAP